MKNYFQYIVMFLLCTAATSAQNAGTAGAFARMGFGARGMAMGNAMTAIITGDISTYYNPALSAFSEHRTAAASFGILSLDRNLNFLNYTQSIKPTAGISVGLINAGVSKIDGRNLNGIHTEDYSTFENQFYLAFSNRVDERISLGVAVKLYYSKIFEEVKSTTVGFDIGVCVRIIDRLYAGVAIQDIGSKYRWDTHAIYPDPEGRSITDKFPNQRRIGLAYLLPSNIGVVSAEFENSSEKTNIFRAGAEYNFMEYFSIRGGVDRVDFSDKATGAKPSFGFSAKKSFGEWTPAVTYAYAFESYAPHGIHIITLSTNF
jgi:hypothetical protein